MQLNSYLLFNGTCEAAFKFYERALGGTIETLMTFGQSPGSEKMPDSVKKRIMHVSLKAAGTALMGSDTTPDQPVPPPSGFKLSVGVSTPEEADRVFNALSEGGKIDMPIGQTFWSPRFGMLTDKFGVAWMVNCMPQA